MRRTREKRMEEEEGGATARRESEVLPELTPPCNPGGSTLVSDDNLRDLEKKGYTVVPGVVPPDECDAAIQQYRDWLGQFGDGFPKCFQSLIFKYNTGHMDTTWKLRMQTKPVFSQIWKTDKLLTSIDAIAIGRPPEDGQEAFQESDKYWLHCDQTSERYGLHAYQGALYLEEQCKDDWTFQVVEGSHKHIDALYASIGERAQKLNSAGAYKMKASDMKVLKKAGCHITRVPVPKGGMVLWDSRLIHANARPLPGRKNPGRWRYVVFACMAPAVWASDADMQLHREAYEHALMTNHWPVQRTKTVESKCVRGINCPDRVPPIAQTEEALRLAGVIPYDFNDGQSNGPDFVPKWI